MAVHVYIWFYTALLWFDSLMMIHCGPKYIVMFSVTV